MSTTPQPAKVFRYQRGEPRRAKTVHMLCRTDHLLSAIQVVKRDGGETNLHAHVHTDGIWFVLAGRARFYTTDDEVVADLGPHEGVLVPKGYPYWFESASDEPLEILQVEASDEPNAFHRRIDYRPKKSATLEAEFIDY